jgi:hypothetical protein
MYQGTTMLKFIIASIVLLLGIVAGILSLSSNDIQKPSISENETKNSVKPQTLVHENTNNSDLNVKRVSSLQTDKSHEFLKKDEAAPEKLEASTQQRKIRSEDGHLYLYDQKGLMIKKQLPDGSFELYNYTQDGERITVKK